MMSTVSQGITPGVIIDHDERGMVQSFQAEYTKGDSKDVWGARKAWGCSCWKTSSEKRHYKTDHCSWSTHKLHDIYSDSSYTTNTGTSYYPFILYATMNTDPNFPWKYINALANYCPFSVAPKGHHIYVCWFVFFLAQEIWAKAFLTSEHLPNNLQFTPVDPGICNSNSCLSKWRVHHNLRNLIPKRSMNIQVWRP